MKWRIGLTALVFLLLVAVLPQQAVTGQGYSAHPIQTKTLLSQDNRVHGDAEYSDARGVSDEWVLDHDIAILGSEVYVEVDPIWRPAYHEGDLFAETELSINGGLADGTANKVDLHVVIGELSWGRLLAWGNWYEKNVVMYPEGTALILHAGDSLSLVTDGHNDIMSAANAVAMYFRAYIFYVDLN